MIHKPFVGTVSAVVVVALAVIVGYVAFPSRAALTPLRTVAGWEQQFLGSWNSEHTSTYLPLSTSADSWDLYDLSYAVDGNTAMYRATGKTQYLDRSLLYVNNAIATAKVSSSISTSQFKDSYLAWVNHSHPSIGNDGDEYPLFESYMWRYVTNMLVAMHADPAVMTNPAYLDQYNKILQFTEVNIFDKWNSRGTNSYIYRERTHMAAHWAFICMDIVKLSSNAARKAKCQAVVDNINFKGLPNFNGASLRGQMAVSPVNASAFFWSDVWGSKARPGQDVAHGNGVMAYIVEAHGMGFYWTNADIAKFVSTLANVIWPSASVYSNFVDGSGTGNGWFNDGFVKLGRYDENLQRRLESHNVGQNFAFNGNGALNAKYLLASSSPTPTVSPSPTPGAKRGDVNLDGHVNVFDLSMLLSAWGTANVAADVNSDGTVNVFDLSILLTNWG